LTQYRGPTRVIDNSSQRPGTSSLSPLSRFASVRTVARRARRSTSSGSRESLSTRELIRTEAERLIAQKGVYGFTLRDITETLEVQVPAIYKHYASRDDVLLEVSRQFIALLSKEFTYAPLDARDAPTATLRRVLDRFVDFHVQHPAYVRLSLMDFATPPQGLDSIKAAAGPNLKANIRSGPLAAMHARLHSLLLAGVKAGEFRPVSELDFYAVVKGTTMLRLTFPYNLLGPTPPRAGSVRRVKNTLWSVAYGFVAADRARS
jgi:AcrR family transcriptional regulator